VKKWLVAALVLLLARRRRAAEPGSPPEPSSSPAESLVAALLLLTALAAVAFVVLYFVEPSTQLLGLTLGLAFAALALALGVAAHGLVPEVVGTEPYPPGTNDEEVEEVVELLEEGTRRVSRRRLLKGAAAGAGLALGGALVVPAASLGPFLGTDELRRSPWRAGRRLVDERDRPIPLDGLTVGAFVTAFPEGAPKDILAAPLIVVRVLPEEVRLPDDRAGWGVEGVLAFSKICPHAGCALSMFRYPRFAPQGPPPAIVCPCHYSTFDPRTGGTLEFGPAGRDLPQLPLQVDGDGNLVARGDFNAPTGPSWWGVRL
jgi:ubiquinol-cytochrome c reductase iron-sulfur subunit